jgi:hypothetical protein
MLLVRRTWECDQLSEVIGDLEHKLQEIRTVGPWGDHHCPSF